METSVSLTAACEPDRLFWWVEDLERYPEWLTMVARAEWVESQPGEGTAWDVELRGRLGPVARSKRLRMVRTVHLPPSAVVFERREVGRTDHSTWVLRAAVASADEGATLEMHLHYGGRLWVPLVERMLTDQIGQGRSRLRRLVESSSS